MKSICVYCGSSNDAPQSHLDLATQVGRMLVKHNVELIYGGGSMGLMGHVADSVLKEGGKVKGIIPKFMKEREWAHLGLHELIETTTMAQRKAQFVQHSDAFIVLPGGIGTFEEFFETISLIKLEQLKAPVVLFNYKGYYNKLIDFLDESTRQRYLKENDRRLWSVVTDIDELPTALGLS